MPLRRSPLLTPRSACLARLGGSCEDRSLGVRGERLRRAIDRKQWVIIGLLPTLKRPGKKEPKCSGRTTPPLIKNIEQSKATRSFEINKTSPKKPKSKANQTHQKPTLIRHGPK